MKCEALLKIIIALIVINLMVNVDFTAAARKDNRRPVFVIASLVNSIEELNEFLDKGANGVEADVWFDKHGAPKFVYEAWPCFVCSRQCGKYTELTKYLEYARDITKASRKEYRKNFLILYLDIKTRKLKRSRKYRSGVLLAQTIMTHLFEGGRTTSRLKLQLSIDFAEDYDFVIGFEDEMEQLDLTGDIKSRIGWDVSFNENLFEIEEAWQKVKSVNNLWIGDGISNCFEGVYHNRRLLDVLDYKNKCKDVLNRHCPQKTFQWVVDGVNLQRKALKLGVDVIFTNKPDQLKRLIKTEFNSTHRMAKRKDYPWIKFNPQIELNND